MFAEAIVPDVGNYLQIDDRHLLWRKFGSSLACLIWGQGGRGRKEWPSQRPHSEALTKSDQEGRVSLPDGGPPICSNSAPGAKDPKRVHKVLEGDGETKEAPDWGRSTEPRTVNSPCRLLLVTVSQTLPEILYLKHGCGHSSSLKGKQAIFKPCHADSDGDKNSERGESGDKSDKYHPCHHGQVKIARAHNSLSRVPEHQLLVARRK